MSMIWSARLTTYPSLTTYPTHHTHAPRTTTTTNTRRQVYKEAVQALALYVGNVLSHPEEAAYKRVRAANPLFEGKVGQFRGGVEALVAAGFKPQREDTSASVTGAEGEKEGEEGEAAAPLQPGQVAAVYQRVFVMHEPEVTDAAWTAWYDRVKAVRDRLQEEAGRRG